MSKSRGSGDPSCPFLGAPMFVLMLLNILQSCKVFGIFDSFVLTVAREGKGKVFPYSLPSVGPGADPGVQAVSPQVT